MTYRPELLRASFSILINSRVVVVRYRKAITGHIIKTMLDGKPDGKVTLPLNEKITIARITLCAVNLLKSKNKTQYENINQQL